MNYTIEETIHDLNELKAQLSENAEKNNELFEQFKVRYPYRSSAESILELLTTYAVDTRVIAKMLIRECNNEAYDDTLIEEIEKISQI